MPKLAPTTTENYSTTVLSSAEEIRLLQPFVGQEETAQNPLLELDVFLASISREWKPRVAVVRRGEQLKGVIYGKEGMFSEVGLGIIYADLSFGSILLGDAASRPQVFLAGIESLLNLNGIRGIRLRICPNSPEVAAIRELTASRHLDTHYFRVKDHACLTLPDTYARFLPRHVRAVSPESGQHYQA